MHQMISANFSSDLPYILRIYIPISVDFNRVFYGFCHIYYIQQQSFYFFKFYFSFLFPTFFFLSLLLLFFLNFNNYHDVFVLLFFLRVFVAFIFSAVLDIIFFASPSGSIRFFGSLLRSISFKTH